MSPGPLHSPGSSSDSNGGDAEGPGPPPAPVSNQLPWQPFPLSIERQHCQSLVLPPPRLLGLPDPWAPGTPGLLALATPMLPSALLSYR